MPATHRGQHAAVAATYALLAVVLTYPLILRLNSELAGNNIDLFLFPWSAWWARQSLRHAVSPLFTPYLYYPQGASLVFHTLALPATGWAALLPDTLTPALCYNLLVVATPLLSGLAAYALALAVTESIPAAAIAGLIYGFTPNRFDQMRGHLDCAFAPFLPLAVLFGMRILRAASPRRRLGAAAGAALMLVLALLTRLEHALSIVYLLGFVLLAYPVSGAVASLSRRLQWYAVAGVLTLVIGAPYFVAAARQWPAPAPTGGYEAQQQITSISAERVALPAASSIAWRWLSVDSPADAAAQRPGQLAFVGYVVILLIAWSALACRGDRQWRFWAINGVFFFIVALGPTLVVRGTQTGIPLPLHALPLLSLARAPNRFVPAAVLCLAMAIAVAWAQRAARSAHALRQTALLAALIALDQGMLPFPTTAVHVSPFYARLAGEREPFGVVEIPANRLLHDKLYMYLQTVHGHPIQGGHISRLVGTAPAPSIPLLQALNDHRATAAPLPAAELSLDLNKWREAGLGYVIFHTAFSECGLPGLDPWEQALLNGVAESRGAPAYRDDQLVVFDLRQ